MNSYKSDVSRPPIDFNNDDRDDYNIDMALRNLWASDYFQLGMMDGQLEYLTTGADGTHSWAKGLNTFSGLHFDYELPRGHGFPEAIHYRGEFQPEPDEQGARLLRRALRTESINEDPRNKDLNLVFEVYYSKVSSALESLDELIESATEGGDDDS